MSRRSTLPRRIVSGGQTGVDRAALDVALDLGIAHGGWCPRGRIAEDGVIDQRYGLDETASADSSERTELNVRDSDGTLILCRGPLVAGTLLTRDLVERYGKPSLTVDASEPADPAAVRQWITDHRLAVLNVAGPRESTAPGIYDWARDYLRAVL